MSQTTSWTLMSSLSKHSMEGIYLGVLFQVLMAMFLPEEAQQSRTECPHKNEMVVARGQGVQWKNH